MNSVNLQPAPPGMLWRSLAAIFCVAFGLAHLLNVFTTGDGLWYWYAVLFDRGQRLYADLHLNLQPLFILMTWASLHAFGHSWLGVRVFPLIQVVLYTLGLYLVAGFVQWSDGKRALLILAAFGVTMTIRYYRFDDFHVTTQILQVYSIWLLLLLHKAPTGGRVVRYAALLGVLAGVSLSNRLNDGAALFAASAVALCGIAMQRRWTCVVVFCGSAAAAFGVILLSTGEGFGTWYRYTVVAAAKIKGGSGHILLYPVTLPVRTVVKLAKDPYNLQLILYPVCIVACGVAVPIIVRTFRGTRRVVLLAGVAALLLVVLPHYWNSVYEGVANVTLANLFVPFAYLMFVLITVRVAQVLRQSGPAEWNSLLLLLLVPTLQLFLASMTGGSGIVEATPALALTLLLLPIVFPGRLAGAVQDGYVVLLVLLSFAAYTDKFLFPFNWHHFYSDQMFENRTWYHSPVYGPMYVDTRQLDFILPMCSTIAAEPGTGLLSAPYPHANYFCNVPPWHGYVQTWYDTSSQNTINALVQELATGPPTWVLYERSVPTMYNHETVYTSGQPLPHRALDQLIVSRVETLQWTVKRQQCFGGADWMLIRTSVPRPGEQTAFPVLMGSHFDLCRYSQSFVP